MAATSQVDRFIPSRARVAFVVALVLVGITFMMRPRGGGTIAIDHQSATSDYAGSAACTGCHRVQSQDFARTAHARALFRADREPAVAQFAGRVSPEPGDQAPQNHRISYDWGDGKLWAASSSQAATTRVPIDWCFGSGEFGTTFVTLLQDRIGRTRLLEHHWSWFRDGDLLALTPGHEVAHDVSDFEPFGMIYAPAIARQCFSCHATAFGYENGKLDTETMIAGVQCERCHGPRKEHVATRLAAANAERGVHAPKPPARQQVYACGECHRRPDEIDDVIRVDNPVIARFPSVGLVQSKCFLATESRGTLTCTTCHNPHRAERPTMDFYDKRCGDCHDARKNRENVPCSIDPGDQSCVGCHMPRVKLHEHLKFTDHWIRVLRLH